MPGGFRNFLIPCCGKAKASQSSSDSDSDSGTTTGDDGENIEAMKVYNWHAQTQRNLSREPLAPQAIPMIPRPERPMVSNKLRLALAMKAVAAANEDLENIFKEIDLTYSSMEDNITTQETCDTGTHMEVQDLLEFNDQIILEPPQSFQLPSDASCADLNQTETKIDSFTGDEIPSQQVEMEMETNNDDPNKIPEINLKANKVVPSEIGERGEAQSIELQLPKKAKLSLEVLFDKNISAPGVDFDSPSELEFKNGHKSEIPDSSSCSCIHWIRSGRLPGEEELN